MPCPLGRFFPYKPGVFCVTDFFEASATASAMAWSSMAATSAQNLASRNLRALYFEYPPGFFGGVHGSSASSAKSSAALFGDLISAFGAARATADGTSRP